MVYFFLLLIPLLFEVIRNFILIVFTGFSEGSLLWNYDIADVQSIGETYFSFLAAVTQKYSGDIDFFFSCSHVTWCFSVEGEIRQIFRVFHVIFQDSCHHVLTEVFWEHFLGLVLKLLRTLVRSASVYIIKASSNTSSFSFLDKGLPLSLHWLLTICFW